MVGIQSTVGKRPKRMPDTTVKTTSFHENIHTKFIWSSDPARFFIIFFQFFVRYNKSLAYVPCDDPHIKWVTNQMILPDGKIRPRFVQHFEQFLQVTKSSILMLFYHLAPCKMTV